MSGHREREFQGKRLTRCCVAHERFFFHEVARDDDLLAAAVNADGDGREAARVALAAEVALGDDARRCIGCLDDLVDVVGEDGGRADCKGGQAVEGGRLAPFLRRGWTSMAHQLNHQSHNMGFGSN